MSSSFVRCSMQLPGKGQELAREIRHEVYLWRYGPVGLARERIGNRENSPGLAADRRNAAAGQVKPKTLAILLGLAEVSRMRDQHEQIAAIARLTCPWVPTTCSGLWTITLISSLNHTHRSTLGAGAGGPTSAMNSANQGHMVGGIGPRGAAQFRSFPVTQSPASSRASKARFVSRRAPERNPSSLSSSTTPGGACLNGSR